MEWEHDRLACIATFGQTSENRLWKRVLVVELSANLTSIPRHLQTDGISHLDGPPVVTPDCLHELSRCPTKQTEDRTLRKRGDRYLHVVGFVSHDRGRREWVGHQLTTQGVSDHIEVGWDPRAHVAEERDMTP